SRAGLIGLAHGYARLLAGDGVTANVITPALIDTEMVRSNPDARRTGSRRQIRNRRRSGVACAGPGIERLHHRPDDRPKWWPIHDVTSPRFPFCQVSKRDQRLAGACESRCPSRLITSRPIALRPLPERQMPATKATNFPSSKLTETSITSGSLY